MRRQPPAQLGGERIDRGSQFRVGGELQLLFAEIMISLGRVGGRCQRAEEGHLHASGGRDQSWHPDSVTSAAGPPASRFAVRRADENLDAFVEALTDVLDDDRALVDLAHHDRHATKVCGADR